MLVFDKNFFNQSIEKFDGIICIDCWDESFSTKYNQIYQNIHNLPLRYQINSLIVSSYDRYDTHYLILSMSEKYNMPIYKITELSVFCDLIQEKNIEKNSSWLVAGAAWNICLHKRDMGFLNFNKIKNINIYTHPSIIGGYVGKSNVTICKEHFNQDKLLTWVFNKENFYKIV